MTLSHKTKIGLALMGAMGLSITAPLSAQSSVSTDEGLAAETLANGNTTRAIQMLEAQLQEYPGDPALLINLGIAHARNGSEAEALASFEAALASREVIELEVADGRTTDSRRLARQAIAMLQRGEFRPQGQSDQFSLRN